MEGGNIGRVYGPELGTGSNPANAYNSFIENYKDLFGPSDGNFVLVRELDVMRGKFKLAQFKEVLGGYEVDSGWVTILVRNEPGYPVVLATSHGQCVEGPVPRPSLTSVQAKMRLREVRSDYRSFKDFKLVIYKSESGQQHLAWRFFADNANMWAPWQAQAFVDANTGKVLEERQAIHEFDVTGTVQGYATPGQLPNQANNPPVLTNLVNHIVSITSGPSVNTNGSGQYAFNLATNAQVTVNASLKGPYVQVVDVTSAQPALSQIVTPNAVANFVFNTAQDEVGTAQVNGFIQTMKVHDFVKFYNPSYPGVDVQIPCNVNSTAGTCNAFFSPANQNINFYKAGGGCSNSCYSTVLWHEYGHFIIDRAGTAQGAYGEGMGDTISALLGDTPLLGQDFRGQGTGPLRNAINSVVYPSVAEIHTAGQIVPGSFWNCVLQLEPSMGHAAALELMRDIAVNSIVLQPFGVTPGLVVDMLTLDDNDANILNGTPHYDEIAAGCAVKNLIAPKVEWVKFTPVNLPANFTYYNGGDFIVPSIGLGGPALIGSDTNPQYPFSFDVADNGGTLNPKTVKVYTRTTGGTWTATEAQQDSGIRWRANVSMPGNGKGFDWYLEAKDTEGHTTWYPLDGPSNPNSTLFGNALVSVLDDTFETNLGWTVANTSVTSGGWARGATNITFLNGEAMNPGTDSNDTGTLCYVTGVGTVGGTNSAADLDGGPTRLTSPVLDLQGKDALITFRWWFMTDDGDDAMTMEISNDNGTTWVQCTGIADQKNFWTTKTIRVGSWVTPTNQVRIRFNCSDNPNNSLTEAAIDWVQVQRISP